MAISKRILILTVSVLVLTLLTAILPIHGEEEIYNTVIRLHVVANSDSEEDQALKLKVRDAVIKTATPALGECKTRTEAVEAIEKIKGELEAAAIRALRENGSDCAVSVELSEEYYPTKNYESCAFPEGKYLSLRVLIGNSEGKNWWCCLFPPLCLNAATANSSKDNEDAFISVGLSSEQYKVITESNKPQYKIRFKILETVSGWFK